MPIYRSEMYRIDNVTRSYNFIKFLYFAKSYLFRRPKSAKPLQQGSDPGVRSCGRRSCTDCIAAARDAARCLQFDLVICAADGYSNNLNFVYFNDFVICFHRKFAT